MFLVLSNNCRRGGGLQIGRRKDSSSSSNGRSGRIPSTKSGSSISRIKVNVAVVLPFSMFKERNYKKKIKQAAESLTEMATLEASGFELSPYLEAIVKTYPRRRC